MNNEDFNDIYARTSPLALSASDFLLPYAYDDSIYANKDVSYSVCDSQEIAYGRLPEKKEEVLISNDFYLRANEILGGSDPSSISNKTFHYRDLSNYPLKLSTRMDLLFESVTVVGITSDSTSSVYMYPSDFQKINNEAVCSSLEYYSLNDSPSSLGKILSQQKGNYSTSLSGTSPSYFLESSKSSPLYPYIIALTIILLALSIIFTMMVCSENVAIRKREIALLESLGISKKAIQECFFFQNGISGLASFLVALILVYPSLFIVNAVLRSPSVFDVAYDVLAISPLIILIGLACQVVTTLASTILPLWRISKIDVLEVLKKN